jgi:hypothetical protein
MNLQACLNELLKLGGDDWLDASSVASVAITVGGAASLDAIRDSSIELITEAVRRGLMELGELDDRIRGFRKWRMSPDRAIARVRQEWEALGRNPSVGEICWLANTGEGDALASQLSARP